MRHRPRLSVPALAAIAVLGSLLASCEAAEHAQGVIHDQHAPRITALVHDDLMRAEAGLTAASTRLGRGFVVEDPAERATQMRTALRLLTEPPRGIPELMISPMTFVAVAGADGIVICRDREPDPMAGQNVAEMFPHVRRALTEGVATRALVEWPGLVPTEPPVIIMVHAVPTYYQGRIAGVVLGGTPLWRTAQRLTRQLQAETADEGGTIMWVYLYRGDALHHRGTPADLDTIVPNAAARAAGFAASPGGFTGQEAQFGRWYAYGVVPLPELGDDVGFIVWRSDPV
ncbi:MAG: hypothetical protein J0L92_35190 [Deltaproteobacteria bacterium]|nr:hypothetical protein [Deltaproteobacteria bacterium]